MFREMRRKTQQLTDAESIAILEKSSSGVLALLGDEQYPYALPISYVYRDGKLYFHCAMAGHKLDAIAGSDKASFCVIDRDQVVPEEYTTYYRSVIAFGRIRMLEDTAAKRAAIECLAEKYAPAQAGADQEINQSWSRLCMLEMRIEHMTGKEAIELRRMSGGSQ